MSREKSHWRWGQAEMTLTMFPFPQLSHYVLHLIVGLHSRRGEGETRTGEKIEEIGRHSKKYLASFHSLYDCLLMIWQKVNILPYSIQCLYLLSAHFLISSSFCFCFLYLRVSPFLHSFTPVFILLLWYWTTSRDSILTHTGTLPYRSLTRPVSPFGLFASTPGLNARPLNGPASPSIHMLF